MKKYIFILLVTVLVIAIGKYLWPFLSYLFGVKIKLLHTIICSILALIGVVSFFIKRTNKVIGIGLIIIASALWFSYFINRERFDVYPQEYRGDYMEFSDPSKKYINHYGLVNKYGQEFIAPRYAVLLKVFDKTAQKDVFIGIQYYKFSRAEADSIMEAKGLNTNDKNIDNRSQVKEIKITSFSLSGERNNVKTIDKMCCGGIEEYISKHIGEIVVRYSDIWLFSGQSFSCIKTSHDEDDINSSNSTLDIVNVAEVDDNSSENHNNQRQQVWKERWKPCISCNPNRKGFCNNCHGEGGYYIGNIFNVCGVCGGARACPVCGGRGEIKETYSTWE